VAKNDTPSAPLPDEELVRRAQAGDQRAMNELVERHQGVVFRVVLGIVGDQDEAADATQDTFLRAFRALDRFRGEARFRTWLLTIATNVARGMLRKRDRRKERPLDDASQVPDEGTDATGELTRAEEAERVTELLSRLPEKQRLAVQLRTQDGLSFRQVGEIIGSSEGAARVNYHHGIRRLREMLK
jgi:RNA polymerase sigma-70 factor, ECF subfamily